MGGTPSYHPCFFRDVPFVVGHPAWPQDFRRRAVAASASSPAFARSFGSAEARQRYEDVWREMIDGTLQTLPELRLEMDGMGNSGSGWWFGCHFLFSHILGIIIPTD